METGGVVTYYRAMNQPLNPTPDAVPPEPTTAADRSGALEEQIRHLMVAAEHELSLAPEGLDELGLIRALQRPPWELLGEVRFDSPEALYPVHFLLFHALYRLRDELARDGRLMHISPLRITLKASTVIAGEGVPDRADALRAFYLDLSHYRLPDDAIHRMMDDFWAGRQRPAQPAPEALTEAAGELGFDAVPAHFETVRHRFRRAVMQAHPDRGGTTEQVQRLNHAFSILKTHYLANA